MNAGTLHCCMYSPFATFFFLHDGHPEDIHIQSAGLCSGRLWHYRLDLSIFFLFRCTNYSCSVDSIHVLPFYVEEPMHLNVHSMFGQQQLKLFTIFEQLSVFYLKHFLKIAY